MLSSLLDVAELPHKVRCVMSSETPYSRYQVLAWCCLEAATQYLGPNPGGRDPIKASHLHSIALRQGISQICTMCAASLHVGRLKDDMYAPMEYTACLSGSEY